MGPLWSRAGLCLDFYLGKKLYDEIVKPDKAITEALKKEQEKRRQCV
jgi:hypothetical protein